MKIILDISKISIIFDFCLPLKTNIMTHSQFNAMLNFHNSMKRAFTLVGKLDKLAEVDYQIDKLKKLYPQYN